MIRLSAPKSPRHPDKRAGSVPRGFPALLAEQLKDDRNNRSASYRREEV